MKKITKTFYVSPEHFRRLTDESATHVCDIHFFTAKSARRNDIQPTPIEITFSVPEKTAQVSESEFKNLWLGSSYEQAAKKLFGESHD